MTTASKVTLSPADSPYVSISVMENHIGQVWVSSLIANHSPKIAEITETVTRSCPNLVPAGWFDHQLVERLEGPTQ
jgi:hypothetical protein